MGVFSFLSKKKQESAARESDFYSYSESQQGRSQSRSHYMQPSTATPKKTSVRDEHQADGMLPEKKRARRRLVGAVALVLAAVIGLPMILDSEPKPLVEDIAIQIPSKEKSVHVRDHLVSVPETSASSLITPQIKEPVVSEAKQPDSSEVNPPSMVVADATEVKKEDPQMVTHKKEQFMLQVAALASAKKVGELQGKLKKAGLVSHTQKVATESGARIRVRLGPFSSRAELDKVQLKLSKLGMSGTVIVVNNE